MCLSSCLSPSGSSPRAPCVPLYCSGVRVGRIKPNILKTLASHPAVFEVVKKEDSEEVERVQLSGDLKTVQERTVALNRVFAELRDNGAFLCLKGWRNEVCVCVGVRACICSSINYVAKAIKYRR